MLTLAPLPPLRTVDVSTLEQLADAYAGIAQARLDTIDLGCYIHEAGYITGKI